MKKFLPRSLNNPSGFTLIELLVVISIIAFLSVIGIVAFTQAQKQGRDGRRKADIEAVATAMESNYTAASGTYTAVATSMFNNNQLPSDPGSNSYDTQLVTTASVAGAGFWSCATLEIASGNASVKGTGTSYPTFVTTNQGAFYCRASQQNK